MSSESSPDTILSRLALLHSVPEGYGDRFRPLVRRALEARPEVRQRILALVETSFAREAERLARLRSTRPHSADWAAVIKVARILHAWNPPDWLLSWGDPSGLDSGKAN